MIDYIPLLIPLLLIIIGYEWYVSKKKDNHRYKTGDTVMNVTIGVIDQIGSLFIFALLYFSLDFVYTHCRLITLENNWMQWLLAYLAIDFVSYWYHRSCHEINILWAAHITHHSSSLYNLSTAFRNSVFQGLCRIPFWAILPLFGFTPIVLLITLKLSAIYDFLVHTTYIPKLGILEKILITPSSHRVHHGKNDIYINKNYGSTFAFWDKLFGTFQEEIEPVVYGIKSEYTDDSPTLAIGLHYQFLWKSLKEIKGMGNKLLFLLKPPGWKSEFQIKSTQKAKKDKQQVFASHKAYAFFQILYAMLSFIILLMYFNLFNTITSIAAGLFIVFALVNSSLILNNNIQEGFEKRELLRLILFAFLILAVLNFWNTYILIILIGYICMSLLYILKLRKEIQA